MIRKHTRRAAKAAFAISLGVAIVIGLFAAAVARPASSAPAAKQAVKFVPLAGISPYQALDKKTVQAAAVFSTDTVLIKANGLK